MSAAEADLVILALPWGVAEGAVKALGDLAGNLGTGTALGGLAPMLLSALAIAWALWLLRRTPDAMRVPLRKPAWL
ncbi:MAG: hypothetical protein ACK4GM_13120 [Tabrizicola sp.]